MAFAAGQQVRGPALRHTFPLIGVATGDTEINNSVDTEPVPGCQVVAEPRTWYAIDGWISYVAGTTSLIKFAVNAPLTAIGDFAVWGPASTVTDSVGSITTDRTSGVGDDDLVTLAGSTVDSGRQVAILAGHIRTGVATGAVQLLFTQATAGSDITAVSAGSWIRLTKIKDI